MKPGYSEWMAATVVCAVLMASWSDYRRHRVPNWLSAAVLVSGLAAQAMFRGWPGVQVSLLGVCVGMGPLLVLWLMRVLGAGDVKFMAALGAWMGPQMTLHALVAGGLIGGVMAAAMLAVRRDWRQTASNLGMLAVKVSDFRTALGDFGSVGRLGVNGGVLPYAIPLGIGTLLVVFSDCFGWWRVLL